MPNRLASPCTWPSCPRLAVNRSRCALHQPKPWVKATPQVGGGRPWRRLRERVLERDGHRCAYCGGVAEVVDHVINKARGGPDSEDNCVASCASCNSKKAQAEARAGRRMTR
jgi:5-methylcytosine-specific restriction protein A